MKWSTRQATKDFDHARGVRIIYAVCIDDSTHHYHVAMPGDISEGVLAAARKMLAERVYSADPSAVFVNDPTGLAREYAILASTIHA